METENAELSNPMTDMREAANSLPDGQVEGADMPFMANGTGDSTPASNHVGANPATPVTPKPITPKPATPNHVSTPADKGRAATPSGAGLSTPNNVSFEKKHSSSSSSHKHHKSSHGDKHRSSSSGEKHHSSSSGDKDKHRSSSDKDKHRDKHHSSSSSKHKSSSSSSKDKDGHSSSSKHKDGHSSSSSSSKHHSSSSKHKHKKEKHRDKDREGEKKPDGDKPKEGDRPKEGSTPKPEVKTEVKVKTEPDQNASAAKSPPTSPAKQVKVEPLSPAKLVEAMRSPAHKQVKKEAASDEDEPLKIKKRPAESDDDEPLSKKKKIKKEMKQEGAGGKKRKADEVVGKKKKKKGGKEAGAPTKKTKKEAEEDTKWKWWEEEKKEDGVKWKYLEHSGPVFAPAYERMPESVRFYYDGEHMVLSDEAEEVAGFYARMLDHDYTTKDVFNKNFFKDWRKVMTAEERQKITNLKLCNFKEMDAFFKAESEKRKNRTKEEKLKLKQENEELVKEYGFCVIDGHKQKIGNFKIEPPGLFRGRGEHPKQGMLKKRIQAEDVIINCSKDSPVPKAPEGHKWKEVRHDNTVTWLCSWTENIQGQNKYIMLNAASKLKGEKDWQKYETARKLHKCVDKIRAQYREDWKSKEMRIRQRAVALYFIDKLALRAGNEKEEGETADTVGCCSLRVEHIKLHEKYDDKEHVVEFDFLGKDSIRYYNRVSVEKRVFKNLQLFMENKNDGDDLFDRLNTTVMNKHLQSLMDGLTAKVFRTFNASKTLQEQLDLLTNPDDPPAAKLLSYNRANRAVAILCNHQRAAPKNFEKQMENLQVKIKAKKDSIKEAKKEVKDAKVDLKRVATQRNRTVYEAKKKKLQRLQEQLTKLEVQATDKDENKEIALSTSKLNYLDPRISVAWCKKWDVPIEKVYNKTQRDKFAWAIDMADEDYEF